MPHTVQQYDAIGERVFHLKRRTAGLQNQQGHIGLLGISAGAL